LPRKSSRSGSSPWAPLLDFCGLGSLCPKKITGFSLTVKPARMGNMTLPVAQRRDRRIQLRTRARGAKEAANYNFVKARLLLRRCISCKFHMSPRLGSLCVVVACASVRRHLEAADRVQEFRCLSTGFGRLIHVSLLCCLISLAVSVSPASPTPTPTATPKATPTPTPTSTKKIIRWQTFSNSGSVSSVVANHTYIDTLPFDGIVVKFPDYQNCLGPNYVANYNTLYNQIGPMMRSGGSAR